MRSLSCRPFHFIAALFVAVPVIPICAFAGDMSCNRIPELQHFDMSEWACGRSLSRLPIAVPKGMALVPACGYKKEEFIGVVGEFYFKGMATVKGKVRHVNNSAPGGAVLFDANIVGKQTPFKSAILSLKFDDGSFAIQKFRVPVAEQSPCISADAAIKVRLLYVKAGYEEDEDGNYPKVFEVLKVGQYEPCSAQEQDIVEE